MPFLAGFNQSTRLGKGATCNSQLSDSTACKALRQRNEDKVKDVKSPLGATPDTRPLPVIPPTWGTQGWTRQVPGGARQAPSAGSFPTPAGTCFSADTASRSSQTSMRWGHPASSPRVQRCLCLPIPRGTLSPGELSLPRACPNQPECPIHTHTPTT